MKNHEKLIKNVEILLIENYGTKCPDYEKDCHLCEVWKKWEEFRDEFLNDE